MCVLTCSSMTDNAVLREQEDVEDQLPALEPQGEEVSEAGPSDPEVDSAGPKPIDEQLKLALGEIESPPRTPSDASASTEPMVTTPTGPQHPCHPQLVPNFGVPGPSTYQKQFQQARDAGNNLVTSAPRDPQLLVPSSPSSDTSELIPSASQEYGRETLCSTEPPFSSLLTSSTSPATVTINPSTPVSVPPTVQRPISKAKLLQLQKAERLAEAAERTRKREEKVAREEEEKRIRIEGYKRLREEVTGVKEP